MNWKGVNVCIYITQHIILGTDEENNDEWILYLIISAFPKRKKIHHRFYLKKIILGF